MGMIKYHSGVPLTRGHEGVVRLLLEQPGVVPDRPDRYGGTPLSADMNGRGGAVKLLQARMSVGSADAQRPRYVNCPSRSRILGQLIDWAQTV